MTRAREGGIGDIVGEVEAEGDERHEDDADDDDEDDGDVHGGELGWRMARVGRWWGGVGAGDGWGWRRLGGWGWGWWVDGELSGVAGRR